MSTRLGRVKLWAALAIGLLLVVFTLQNTEVVELRFLFWSVEMSRAIMLFGVFSTGLVIGWLTNGLGHRGNKS